MDKISDDQLWLWYIWGLIAFITVGFIADKFGMNYHPIVLWIACSAALLFPICMIGKPLVSSGSDENQFGELSCEIASVIYSIGVLLVLSVAIFIMSIMIPSCKPISFRYWQIDVGNVMDSNYICVESRLLLFVKRVKPNSKHDIRMLKRAYHTNFTLVENSEGVIRRYHPKDYSDIAVRVYEYGNNGSVDDFGPKLTSKIALNYMEENQLRWQHKTGRRYEDELVFLLYEEDNLEQFAEELFQIIEKICEDPFFKKNDGYISVKIDMEALKKISFSQDKLPTAEEIFTELNEGRKSGEGAAY